VEEERNGGRQSREERKGEGEGEIKKYVLVGRRKIYVSFMKAHQHLSSHSGFVKLNKS
jgi:hypothetical protein